MPAQSQAIKEQASLYFSEGSSDKEYHAQIIEANDGFLVNFQYGRRGAALTAGSKTSSPLPYEATKKTFDKLLKEKTGKGYTPDVSGAAYQGAENAGLKTDFVPQLLNAVTEDEAMRLISDSSYAVQQKMDGERRAAHAEAGQVIGMNRKGLAVPLPQSIADELNSISGDSGAIRVDGEIVGETLHVFDMHVYKGNSIRALPWLKRMRLASETLAGCKQIKAVPVAATTDEKRALWDKVRAAHGEGVVFKRSNCEVSAGRPNSGGDWLKFKFTESASCEVLEIHPTKRSVALRLYDNGDPVSVGNATIPPNYPIPSVGDVVEVEYLYAYRNGSLYQPVFRGVRADIDRNECVLSQLKYKPDGCAEEDSE